MRSHLILNIFLIIFIIINTNNSGVQCKDEYSKSNILEFPVYEYKKNSGLENKYYGRVNRCSFKTDCQNYELEEYQNCVLQCVSPKCYKEIYSPNPLEDGEVDQRLQSFKGCLYLELK